MSVAFTFDTQNTQPAGSGMREISGIITVTNYVQYVASPLAGETLDDLEILFKKDCFGTSNLTQIFFEFDGTNLWRYKWADKRLRIVVLSTAAQAAAGGNYATHFLARGKG